MCKPLCPITQGIEFAGTLVSMLSVIAAGADAMEEPPKTDEEMTQAERRADILDDMDLEGRR